MSIEPGTRLGVFEIAQLIGAGGMGEVYRARDTKLGREVAIKVLPEDFAKDSERLARFEREAQMLAALDHPNIAALYEFRTETIEEYIPPGFAGPPSKGDSRGAATESPPSKGDSGGAAAESPPLKGDSGGCKELRFLVMQLIEGETLAVRIERGPIPVAEALPIFVQIAGALEAAHDRGIVHRDLKPANIKLGLDDRVKVLDFGIAKSFAHADMGTASAPTPTPSSPDASTVAGTPTPPWSITGAETFVGTPSYMSPEQARGKQVDKRSDIFAFGCCLYEALAGRKTFSGETLADTISSITRDEPDWSRLPQDTPESLRNLLRRCLEKNPRRRLSSAGDIAITLEDTAESIKRDLRRPPTPESLESAAAGTMQLPPITSLAVLPFDNLMGDPEQEYFVDGMTDALSAELGKIKALRVISRSSAMRYKGTDKPLPQIARELGVEALVEGSVFRAGDEVRITAQLIHGVTDSHLWAESYPGTLENILKLQGEVAMVIAKAIQVAVTPEEEKRITTAKRVDPEAYEAYLRGRFFVRKVTPDGYDKAVKSFQRAVELDPGFAEAHAFMGQAYWSSSNWGFVAPVLAVARARPAINTALALDDTLSGAHVAGGWIALAFDWDWARAEREFLRAIELNPGPPGGHDGLAWYYASLGRFDDAIRETQETINLDPLNLTYSNNLAGWYADTGRHEEAISQRQKVLELNPAYLGASGNAALDYILLSRYDEAVEVIERGIAIHGQLPLLLGKLIWAHAAAGRQAEAEALLAALHARHRDGYVIATTFAQAYAALGDMDEAFRWIERALEDRDFNLSQPYWPAWNLLRDDPRFLDMLRRINYPAISAFETAMQNAASAKTTQKPIA